MNLPTFRQTADQMTDETLQRYSSTGGSHGRVINSLLAHARQTPDVTAIITGKTITSYQQLAARATSRALWLTQQHCQTLAFQLDNGLEWVITDLAGLLAGVDIVPIPSFFSQQQIAHVLDDAKADVFLGDLSKALHRTQEKNPDGACASQWQVRMMPEADIVISVWQRDVLQKRQRSPMKLTYTSGSTGTPRGVCLAFETIDTVASSIVSAMEPLLVERHLCLLSLATLLENIAGLYAPLIRGITVQVPSLQVIGLTGASLDIEKFCAAVNSSEADSIIIVPQLLTALVTLTEFGMLQTAKLKMIAVGGGRVSEHLLTRAKKLGLPVFQGYGLSECASVLTLNLPSANRAGSVGRALPHAELRINKLGEIEARGSNMLGYLGYIDADGFVFITGRIKNVFITSLGRNVSPEWVESSLTQHPAIAHALITGEGRDHNLALIWTRFPQTPDELSELVNAANAELPDYARSHAHLVMHTALTPELVTPNGRLKRQLAVAQFQTVINDHYETMADATTRTNDLNRQSK